MSTELGLGYALTSPFFIPNLDKLTTQATSATAAPTPSEMRGALSLKRWNMRATSVAPVIWPINRAMASMPLALPLRLGGAEVIKIGNYVVFDTTG